ncbi:hypothetical protein chiPu_0011746 [Chiloscyllium punctatum]|uniref:Uncharacterized protein n=1 Tax=Chiloscyllium punctatum TaxID=137246 RepID=A0A401SS92_CHIPU|nr:hypothetical protein [Chiloscyllium punctatum]
MGKGALFQTGKLQELDGGIETGIAYKSFQRQASTCKTNLWANALQFRGEQSPFRRAIRTRFGHTSDVIVQGWE